MPILLQAVEGSRPPLTVYGTDYPTRDGSCIRDFIHVCDLAQAHVDALRYLQVQPEKSLAEAFNIGTGTGTSVRELLDGFQQATGQPVPYEFGNRRPGDIVVMYANAEKAARLLGWKAERTVNDAMRDAWRWWRGIAQADVQVDQGLTASTRMGGTVTPGISQFENEVVKVKSERRAVGC